MTASHNKLILEAATTILAPLGFRRKGKSRTWVWDHGWWLAVVEFQPSAFAKGSGLNVGAHWLWTDQAHISFDFFECWETFIEYASDAQFEPVATLLAQSAAREARRLGETFPSIDAAAAVLAAKEGELPDGAQGSWGAYDAGMAMALSARPVEAATLFSAVRDERVRPAVSRFENLLSDPVLFRRDVDKLIATHRRVLGIAQGQD